MANLGIYLQAKLERNVEILDKPNPRLRISKKAELSDCLPILDIAIGAALRRLIQFKNTINLLPFEHLLQRKLKSKRSNVITIFCVLFLIILGGIWFKTKEKSNLKNELKIAREKLNTLTPQTKRTYRNEKYYG